jgi:hypothetical protein
VLVLLLDPLLLLLLVPVLVLLVPVLLPLLLVLVSLAVAVQPVVELQLWLALLPLALTTSSIPAPWSCFPSIEGEGFLGKFNSRNKRTFIFVIFCH